MIPIQTVEDVYPAMEELIVELQDAGHTDLATVIDHRMHKVAWTARCELLEELQEVLRGALNSTGEKMPALLSNQIGRVLVVIESFLQDR